MNEVSFLILFLYYYGSEQINYLYQALCPNKSHVPTALWGITGLWLPLLRYHESSLRDRQRFVRICAPHRGRHHHCASADRVHVHSTPQFIARGWTKVPVCGAVNGEDDWITIGFFLLRRQGLWMGGGNHSPIHKIDGQVKLFIVVRPTGDWLLLCWLIFWFNT